MNEALHNNWGNPSSLHTLGINAEQSILSARQVVADILNADSDEIYFTGGGTEANNIAIFGAANSGKKRGKRIVTTSIEHPSVLECIKQLEKDGFEVIYLKPDNNGTIKENDIYNAVNKDTILVSIMLVNNEIGSIQPIYAAADAIKKVGAPALLHCDAVQAFGKLPIDVHKLGVDLLSLSGHKIHAPKGIGVLYKRKGRHINSLIFGGGQEKGVRPGTESVPLICALKGAVEELGNIETALKKQKALFNYAKEKISSTFPNAHINSSDNCLPYILNFSVNTHRSETLLHFLEIQNIFVSSGSACAKGQRSHVLTSLGFDNRRIDSALRLSFNRVNTKDEIDKFCEVLSTACNTLRKA